MKKKLIFFSFFMGVFLIFGSIFYYFFQSIKKTSSLFVYSSEKGPFYHSLFKNNWVLSSFYDLDENEKKILEKYIVQMEIHPSDLEIEKIEKIVKFLNLKLDSQRGDPKDLNLKRPYEVFNVAFSYKTKINCTHFADIYALVANYMGIPTRLVHIRNYDGDPDSMHVVTESYIKSEDKWVMVDPTYKEAYFLKENENNLSHLSTLEVLSFYRRKSENGFLQSQYSVFFAGNIENIVKSENAEFFDSLSEQSKYFNNKTTLIYNDDTHSFGDVVLY